MTVEREEMIYVGDGIRAPEPGELIGQPVNVNGRRGRVVANGPLSMTVEWESRDFVHSRDCKSSLCQFLWWLFGKG